MIEDEKQINYFKIALAVCGGILMASAILSVASILILNAVVDTQVKSINDQAAEFSRSMQEKAVQINRESAQRQEQQRIANEQQRMNSKTGQTLARECSEYSQFYRDNPSDYAKAEREKVCGKYRTYVSTGRLSN